MGFTLNQVNCLETIPANVVSCTGCRQHHGKHRIQVFSSPLDASNTKMQATRIGKQWKDQPDQQVSNGFTNTRWITKKVKKGRFNVLFCLSLPDRCYLYYTNLNTFWEQAVGSHEWNLQPPGYFWNMGRCQSVSFSELQSQDTANE